MRLDLRVPHAGRLASGRRTTRGPRARALRARALTAGRLRLRHHRPRPGAGRALRRPLRARLPTRPGTTAPVPANDPRRLRRAWVRSWLQWALVPYLLVALGNLRGAWLKEQVAAVLWSALVLALQVAGVLLLLR